MPPPNPRAATPSVGTSSVGTPRRIGGGAVLAAGAGIIVMLACAAALLIWTGYEREAAQARVTAINLSTTLAAHARQSFTGADQALRAIVSVVQSRAPTSEAGLRALAATQEMSTLLQQSVVGMPQVFRAAVIDRTGQALGISTRFPTVPFSIADRDYFQQAIKPGFTGMALGNAVQNRVDGTWTFFIARQITAPDATPIGVVSIGMPVNFFQNFYGDLTIGANSSISLFRADGMLLARAPAEETLLGTSFAGRLAFTQAKAMGMDRAVVHVDTPRRLEPSRPVPRLISYRTVDNFPVIVSAAIADEYYLAAWHRTALAICGVTLTIAAVVAGLSMALARMLTRLHESEARLLEQHRLLDITLDAMDEGILLITGDHRVLVCNRRARVLLDLPEAMGQTPHSFHEIRAIQFARREFADPITGEQPPMRPDSVLLEAFEYERTRPNGNVLAVRQIPLDDGGAVRVFTYITRRHHAEAKLRQSQKLEALGQLTAGIAHDFNNILSVIVTNLELLIDPSGLPPAAVPGLATRARNAALTAGELVRGLLSFSRQHVLQAESADIAHLIARATPLLRQAVGPGMSITTSFATDLWPAQVDISQVESAMLNLALNARDASPAGGELHITAANVSITRDRDKPERDKPAQDAPVLPGDYVELTLTDTGAGMAPDVVARAFEPFFTTKPVGEGSGLGLSMVFGAMQQLGGGVGIDSTPGRGTRVRLYLPRAPMAPGPTLEAPRGPVDAHAAAGPRILLVEDNDGLRNTTASVLKMLGYEVVTAADAAHALEIWRQDSGFDIVFSDVIMPGGMNGLELAQRLRADAPGLKILLTSGFSDPGGTSRAVAEMGLAILQKPYLKADLARRLATLMEA